MPQHLSNIREFLVNTLLTKYQKTDVAWPNMPYKGDRDDYIAFNFAQSDIRQAEYGSNGMDFRNGLCQIDVYKPVDKGGGHALEKAEEIAALFHRGLSGAVNGTEILIRRSVIESPLQNDVNYRVPVSIYWESFTTPL